MTRHRSPLVPEGDATDHPLREAPPRHFSDQPTLALRSGREIPRLGIGTWQLSESEAATMTASALELGVRHIDTAQSYENEQGVGVGLERAAVDRADVFVTTKVADDNHEPAQLVSSVERSLERLGTDHIDLLLLHWPVDYDRIGATIAAMVQVQAAGLAHHLGVSNFTVDQLDNVEQFAPFEVLQVECHPFLQQSQLRTWCREHDWVLTAYSPLARGDVLNSAVLDKIAEAHDVTPVQVTLAWLLSLDGVLAIPRTGDEEHLRENWKAREIDLDEAALDAIAKLEDGRRLVDPEQAPW